jgi:serine/alanine racemase
VNEDDKKASEKKRLDIFDVTKLFLAVLIVFIHTAPLVDIWPFCNVIITGVARLAVPLFFLISVYLAYEGVSDFSREQMKKFVFRIGKLYLIYFVMFFPITLYNQIIIPYLAHGMMYAIATFVRNILFAGSFSASWYLNASILGMIICFLLSGKRSIWLWVLGILGQVLSIIASNYWNLLPASVAYGLSIYEQFFYAPYMTVWVALIYFAIGRYLAETDRECWFLNSYRKIGLLLSSILFLTEVVVVHKFSTGVATDALIFCVPTSYFIFINSTFAPQRRHQRLNITG